MTGFNSAPEERVLEGIADFIADDRGGRQRAALSVSVHFDDLLGVVPRGSGGGTQEIAWVETERSQSRNHVSDKERTGSTKAKSAVPEEDARKMLNISLLRVLVQISTTFFCLSQPEAFSRALSSLILL